jgi:hypothetical protein
VKAVVRLSVFVFYFAIHNQIPLGKIRPINRNVKATEKLPTKTPPANQHNAIAVSVEMRSTAMRFRASHFFIEKLARVK